jgi:ParB-like chromosome segregation protein Spo0J
MPIQLTVRHLIPKPIKTSRNPLLYARELRDWMLAEGINRAELARRLGVSRARVTQWLDLLELPERVLREAEALGDCWDRQVVTEREMRRSRRAR